MINNNCGPRPGEDQGKGQARHDNKTKARRPGRAGGRAAPRVAADREVLRERWVGGWPRKAVSRGAGDDVQLCGDGGHTRPGGRRRKSDK
ncbi:hypothetical protein CTheo_710 [Ceratobasidium theobromae]|uniref:Uncharacterized protein n=1 Tax=Ceratobasidium theobromae TaxID=1582974 RepID=A0A5N5QXN0_9AGAM|nr:hypothetical protein CTheo_710 [Ceratobasidium theobromae]